VDYVRVEESVHRAGQPGSVSGRCPWVFA